MIRQTNKHNQQGFTIIELMFATVVFSLVLVICLNAMVQIGSVYYKGVTTARTQEAARNVLDEITRSIQFSAGEIRSPSAPGGSPPYQVACAGDLRLSFVIDRQLKSAGSNESRKQSRHVMWIDELSNCNSRAPLNPLDLSQVNPGGSNGREILGENMRLSQLSIAPGGAPGLWQVNVGVVYGDEDLLEVDASDGNRIKCNPTMKNARQYCAASYLSSTVQRRVQ